jgi:hypothetical protein
MMAKDEQRRAKKNFSLHFSQLARRKAAAASEHARGGSEVALSDVECFLLCVCDGNFHSNFLSSRFFISQMEVHV